MTALPDYAVNFIEFLLLSNALKVGKKFKLKSGRLSEFFINVGDFDDGETSTALGGFYADALIDSGVSIDLLYGIPDKGREIVVAVSNEMARKGKNVPRFSTRRVPKDHGEASAVQIYGEAKTVGEFIAKMQHLSQDGRAKAWVIGRIPKNGQRIVKIDDVFTTGDAKYEALSMLKFLGEFSLPLLAIAVDRQEVSLGGIAVWHDYEKLT